MASGTFEIIHSVAGKRQTRVATIKNVTIAILVVVVIALAIVIAVQKDCEHDCAESGEPDGRPLPPPTTGTPIDTYGDVCLSEHCVGAAHTLFTNMNLSASPCEDFNEFACGKFLKEFVIPEDKSRWSSFTPIGQTIYERGKVILEENVSTSDWPTFRQAKAYYKSCMDEEALEDLGVEPLKMLLTELGGWPILDGDTWTGDAAYNWTEHIFKLSRKGLGRSYIFSTYISIDDRNTSWRTVFLDQASLGLSREYLIKGFDDKNVQHYFTYMKDAAEMLGANMTWAVPELQDVLNFEMALANISAPREERRNATKLYNPTTLNEFDSLPSHLSSWHEYMNQLFFDVDIAHDEKVVVRNPDFFHQLDNVISARGSGRTLANYIGWRVTKSVISYLNQRGQDVRLKYRKALYGVKALAPRWRFCANVVGFNNYGDTSLRIPVASMYVQRHFSPQAKKTILDMIKYLKQAFSQILQNLDWMDDETKGRAQAKLERMNEFIAYPEEILNKDIVESHHRGLVIQDNDLFGNLLRLKVWNRQFKDKRLREMVDKESWIDHSLVTVVNAFANFKLNAIEFPAGILQGVFFNHQVPSYLNFGAIGAVIGHEITHLFDDRGRQYDSNGDLRNWWEEDTKAKFVNKTKCIIDQYGSYRSSQVNMSLNGITTQGENIADNGGIKEAYLAYKKWKLETDEGDIRLPGLNFSPEQLFWISWSQVWCTKYRNPSLRDQIETGVHSPGLYRIIGPLSNSPHFAAAFNCPRDSTMNPDNKCSVW